MDTSHTSNWLFVVGQPVQFVDPDCGVMPATITRTFTGNIVNLVVTPVEPGQGVVFTFKREIRYSQKIKANTWRYLDYDHA